ncbi:MAG TPA: DUF4954 family protein [Paludibacter sp.]|nr:DUF4954 family protein [Paludibacter sp.]
MDNYRALTEKEIATLTVYGCTAGNWKDVMVAADFSASYISNVHFSGKVFLGTYGKVFELPGGVRKHAGIFNCVLHNCEVGNDVFIDKIHNYIANYRIGEGTFIENVNLLAVDGTSAFGNGTKVATMIESGAREITIFDRLSAPLAYMMVFYRHNTALTRKLEELAARYSEKQRSDRGRIGENVRILNCGSIKNVVVGDAAQLDGVALLENGTVASNMQAPVILGAGVQCNDFIIQSGSSVTDGAMITRCLVGQGCLVGKQFSAIDSLFFANCQGLHGEAVSIFGGPYTVTHHKSTLMLTALYSFMNAGSGSNFSNHMYKLGPVHQGIMERGVKTSSNSYVMWPARIGAFSVVLGSHKGNPDISELPFSYLLENEGESHLLPGINLHSAGTFRDVQKWPKRDLRKGELIDPICFDFLSPYTIYKAMKGIGVLKELLRNMDETDNFVWYQNCKIKRSAIRKGIELYEMAVDSFISRKIQSRIGKGQPETVHIEKLFAEKPDTGTGQWVDMAGLMAPKSEIDKLIGNIAGAGMELETILQELMSIHEKYDDFALNFALDVLGSKTGKPVEKDDILIILEAGEKANRTFNEMILRDAKKEFSSLSKTGFGIDGDETDKNADFAATRGTFDDHPFVKEMNGEMK